MRATTVARLWAVLATGLLTMPGIAHADAQDDQFLAALSAQGIPGDQGQMIAAGQATCANYGGPALAAQMTGLMTQGLSDVQAQDVIYDGLTAYCPEKAGGICRWSFFKVQPFSRCPRALVRGGIIVGATS
jgi:hypothetical protein